MRLQIVISFIPTLLVLGSTNVPKTFDCWEFTIYTFNFAVLNMIVIFSFCCHAPKGWASPQANLKDIIGKGNYFSGCWKG